MYIILFAIFVLRMRNKINNMKKIINYHPLLHRLSDVEHYTLFDSIILHIYSLLRPQAMLPSWESLVQTFAKEDELYKQTAQYAEARLIKLAHRERRESYIMLREWFSRLLEPYGGSEKVQEAALMLQDAADKYDGSYSLPVDQFTKQMLGLLQDLEDEKYARQVEDSGSYPFLSRLRRHNDEFISLYTGRTCPDGLQDEGPLAEARRQTDRAFEAFADFVVEFYNTEEALRPKDPLSSFEEVNKTLKDVINFVDAYIQQNENFYAHRTPGLRVPCNDPLLFLPDEAIPGREIPQLAIASQEIPDESAFTPGHNRYGTQISLCASDPEAFDAALFPIARNSVLRFRNPRTGAFANFPVIDFLSEPGGVKLSGLLVGAPDANTLLGKTYVGNSNTQAEVINKDETHAILTGVQYPATVRVSVLTRVSSLPNPLSK